jgi:hypothetical protein
MSFAADIERDAAAVINELGVAATLTGAPTLDPSTGESAAGASSATVSTPVGIRRGYVASDGATVREAAFAYCLPTVEPEVGGSLTIGAETWRITSVRVLRGGTDAACYRMEVAL